MPHRILTIIQARTGSTRLPEKVLLPLGETNVLSHLIDRVRSAKLSGTVLVATTTEREDRTIVSLCREKNVPYYCGHPTDLLDRYFGALQAFPADAVVKIPADCPFVDPNVIDRVIHRFIDDTSRFDYVSNLHPASYPEGNDVEIMSASALEAAFGEASLTFEREHVTPFLWENRERFRIGSIVLESGLKLSNSHRWVLDYREDYLVIREIFAALYPQNPFFGVSEIIAFLEKHPDIRAVNEKHLGKTYLGPARETEPEFLRAISFP